MSGPFLFSPVHGKVRLTHNQHSKEMGEKFWTFSSSNRRRCWFVDFFVSSVVRETFHQRATSLVDLLLPVYMCVCYELLVIYQVDIKSIVSSQTQIGNRARLQCLAVFLFRF